MREKTKKVIAVIIASLLPLTVIAAVIEGLLLNTHYVIFGALITLMLIGVGLGISFFTKEIYYAIRSALE